MKLLCWFGYHKLQVIKTVFEGSIQKLYCTRCKKYYAINHRERVFLPLDSELDYMFLESKE